MIEFYSIAESIGISTMSALMTGGSTSGASLASATSEEVILKPEQILTFQEVAPTQEQTLPSQSDIPAQIKSTAVEGRDHNIKDFLERVYKISAGTISEGGASGDVLDTFVFPDLMLGLKQISNKISGFLNFRADVVVTFVITAQPAQLGGLRLTYFPDVADLQVSLRTQHVLQLSQGPHITINIAKNQNSTIKLPWISPYTHRNLVTGVGRNGTLVLSRLTPSAGGVVSYQMYAQFENISIEYPTGMENAEEIATRLLERERESEIASMVEELNSLRLQVKPSQTKTQGISEAVGFLGSGVLSQTASTVSGVANMLGGIPVIGGLASAISPIAGAVANVLASFGMSKPVNDKPPSTLTFRPGISTVTSDGVFNGHELTIATGNTVTTDPGSFGSKVDEMSIDFIMRAPNTIDVFPISTEMTPGTVLARYPIDLCKWADAGGAGSYLSRRFYLTHQTMVATMFKWWMATIVFDFEAYMTKFHNVRLRFAVIPGATDSTDLTTVTIDDNNSAVVVFGDTVTHSVKCPEVSATPFLSVRGVEGELDPGRDQTLTTIGQLVVFLEVPLKATSEVAPTTVYVETKFHATNVRLGLPSQAFVFPIDNVTIVTDEQDEIRTQGLTSAALYPEGHLPGRAEVMESDVSTAMNSDGAKPNGGILHATFGEMVQSVKQLMLSFQYFGYLSAVSVLDKVLINVGVARLSLPTLTPNDKNIDCDIIDAIMSMYAFTKGGFYLRMINDIQDTALYQVDIDPRLSATDRVTVVSASASMGTRFRRTVPVYPFLEAFADVRVPYYQGTHITRVTYDSLASTEFLERTPVFVAIRKVVTLASEGTVNYGFQRAVADDFSLGFLFAPPPLQIAYNQIL